MNSFQKFIKAGWCKSSLRMVSSSSSTESRRIPAAWLRQVVEDKSEAPRLYAWRLANLPDGEQSYARNSPEASQSETVIINNTSDDERRRIYILGVGNIGRLYAIFLAKNNDAQPPPSPPPPITLVVHRRELLEQWKAHPGIELVRRGDDGKREVVERNPTFRVEWWTDAQPTHGPVREPGSGSGVRNLIVATKAPDAIPQVDRVRRYLGGASTVAFAQNGMCKLWPPLGEAYVAARFGGITTTTTSSNGEEEEEMRRGPQWLACVTTHGVTSLGPFRSVHASPADVLVGPVMVPGVRHSGRGSGDGRDDKGSSGISSSSSTSEEDKDRNASSSRNYLVEQIVRAPRLNGRKVATRELWVAQLEKLVVNSVINPLTAVLRCKNGELFEERGDGLKDVVEMLVDEASRTLRALVAHPSSEGILSQDEDETGSVIEGTGAAKGSLAKTRGELLERFSPARLRTMLHSVGEKVAANTSSMLQDVRAGKKTEIEDFNGWLVETARYLGDGSGLPVNEKLISLVVDGAVRTRDELVRELRG
ncbi:6-phosphogluconate dehydrogenase C-terminal domain-like protein [Daldinia caldariorum]|uniref:6-phosphogluconate dehydrogenase C-terminal domain-like protein n=1 Tax=Daldinia caldariorum TaxID=326644 RepID=UPI0020085A74|nr:6-phosphogluconate dehydrogenase C-terminal domain-like protein [Daldinia caldariorum]KAI1463310.1 6-phosphogluconate dehydrogenase C-terminal domain-like protein [Daldinia caldariorum]